MGHKAATFEYPSKSEQYSREPQLPPNWIRTRSEPKVKNYYNPTWESEFRVTQRRRRRRRRRQADYKRLVVLAPTLILGLLMLRLLFSFLPISSKAEAPQQFDKLPQKVAVLPSPAQVNPAAIPPVVALSRAIIGQESSNESKSLNSHSGALGLAQIMPANLSAWSQDILGYRLTPDQFLNNPELQLKIIEHKLSEYWQEALADSDGDEEVAVLRVASYWYSGNPNNYTSTVPQSYQAKNGKLHRYPSVSEYSNLVLKKYKQYRGGAI